MPFKCKRRFTALLRKSNIHYTTQRDFISIGNFHLFFNGTHDTITIRTPICPQLDYVIHYATPETLFAKYMQYKQLVKTFLAYKKAATMKDYQLIGLS